LRLRRPRIPASVPEKTEVSVQRLVRMRVLCCTEAGWRGEKEGEMRVGPVDPSGPAGRAGFMGEF